LKQAVNQSVPDLMKIIMAVVMVASRPALPNQIINGDMSWGDLA
jgi:hypothetical protein